jgi:hypothetical protein
MLALLPAKNPANKTEIQGYKANAGKARKYSNALKIMHFMILYEPL